MTNTAKGYLVIDGEEFEVAIDYDYQPAEKAVLYPNDAAHPGCHEEYEVTKVTYDDGKVVSEKIKEENLEYLEQCCEDHHHDEAAALAESKADAEYNDRLERD